MAELYNHLLKASKQLIMRSGLNHPFNLVMLLTLFVYLNLWSCGGIHAIPEENYTMAIRVPFARVLIANDSDRPRIGAENHVAIECIRDGQQQVFYSPRPVVVRLIRGKLEVRNSNDEVFDSQLDEVNIIPRGANNLLTLGEKQYRGIAKLLPDDSTVQVINVVYMEEYLRGVVPPEIGPRTSEEFEAIKAQAIAARTYAMAHLNQYEGKQYDLKATVADQVYEGVSLENDLVNAAVRETSGKVIVYQDDMIDAYYHSTCGGRTDNIEDIWEKEPRAYLKAVSDDDACNWSKYWNWTEQFTEPQLRTQIERHLSTEFGRRQEIGRLEHMTIGERTAGGRIQRLSVRTENDVFRFAKDRVRWAIGRASNPALILPSARFELELERDRDSNLTEIIVTGRGYGHGVGMCQCGAIGNARNGWDADRILKHYYSGVDIKLLY